MQLYGRGLRRRLAPMLGGRDRLELAYSLLFSLPGASVLRYGEEIGMGENLRLKERDAIRTPMQWSDARNGGFSDAKQLVRPTIERGPYGFKSVNVEAQQRDPDSLLRFLTRVIRVRKQCPEIGNGEWRALATRKPQVLAVQYALPGRGVVCVHNLGDAPAEVSLTVDLPGGEQLESLLGPETSTGRGGTHRLRLDPYGYAWYRAKV